MARLGRGRGAVRRPRLLRRAERDGGKEGAAALLLHENIVQSGVAPICAFDTECRQIASNKAEATDSSGSTTIA